VVWMPRCETIVFKRRNDGRAIRAIGVCDESRGRHTFGIRRRNGSGAAFIYMNMILHEFLALKLRYVESMTRLSSILCHR
jgi:hypothetical protein